MIIKINKITKKIPGLSLGLFKNIKINRSLILSSMRSEWKEVRLYKACRAKGKSDYSMFVHFPVKAYTLHNLVTPH